MRRGISFGCAALICAFFLCVELVLVSAMPSASSLVSAGVISLGFYEHTESHEKTEPYWIRINIPAFTLTLFSGKSPVKTYPIAVGKPAAPSRIGTCEVVAKAKYPTWYPPDGKPPVPPGPDNPISCRWLGLSWSGYGIHGTNNPASIGKAVTLGCIRMHDEDVMELFDIVAVGTTVEFVYETEEVNSYGDGPMAVRLTVYRDLYELGTNTVERVMESLRTYLARVMPGAEPYSIESCAGNDTATIPHPMPDIDQHSLAALISAARGKPEPVPWQVRVELCGECGPCNAIGDFYRAEFDADFDVDVTACENSADTCRIEALGLVRVETELARIEGSQILVALRPVAETFGYRVAWDGEWQAAIVNQNVASGVVREGRLYVTPDELSRLLDELVITWDPQTLTLRITRILTAAKPPANW
ncbi:MAG: L,D-transpeptidase family protein [Firmicutes bacterium]|nr:L,D-transpeptidase family protein [Bacillota bacterium]